MSEGLLQAYFKRKAKQERVYWRKIKFEGQRGCPDCLIAFEGRIVLVELKRPDKRGWLSELQKKQIKRLTDAGIEAHVIDSKDGIDAIIKDITTPRNTQIKHS